MTSDASADRTSIVHPLRRLWRRQRQYRGRVIAALAATSIGKIADVMPELLIGAAVDVVVRGADSFVADVLGVESRSAQIGWIAVLNAVVWIIESVCGYLSDVLWRGIAQRVEHDLRVDAYDHVQHLDVEWHERRTAGNTLSC